MKIIVEFTDIENLIHQLKRIIHPDKKIEDLNISARTKRALQYNNYKYVSDLPENIEKLLNVERIGKKGLEEIKNILKTLS